MLMHEFESLQLSTETLRELANGELTQVVGGARPVTDVDCRPFTDGCGILSVTCWPTGGLECVTTPV